MDSSHPTSRNIVHGKVILSPRVVTLALDRVSDPQVPFDPLALLSRHLSGDWGNVPLIYSLINDHLRAENERVVSRFEIFGNTAVTIVTDIDPKQTIVFFEDEVDLLKDELGYDIRARVRLANPRI